MRDPDYRLWTIPNLLTFLRVILIPFFLWQILKGHFATALGIFFVAGITDGLDGMIARKFDQGSRLGQWLDPLADKLLAVSTYIVLSLPGQVYDPIPLWLTAVVVLRDVGIVAIALLIRHRTGFSDFKPSQPGKWNTTILLMTGLAFMITHALDRYTDYLIVFYFISLVMTVYSGLHYIFFIRRTLASYRGASAKQ